MRIYVRNVLRGGVPLALVSAAVGYGLASFAGVYADARTANHLDGALRPSAVMKVRLPIVMGVGSFALLALLEAPAAYLRGRRADGRQASAPPPKVASGIDSEVEALLNSILARTEAEDAETPSPRSGPTAGASRL